MAELHHLRNFDDVLIRYVLMKEVAHRVYEDHLRNSPTEWLSELLRNEPQVEAEFIRVTGHAAEPLGERLSVATPAALADFRAPTDRVPRRVSPLDR